MPAKREAGRLLRFFLTNFPGDFFMLWSKALSVLSAEFGLRALKKNAAVVTAESCTAGGIANAIAATPGASAWLKGGWVTYQTSQKIDWLGVPEELIASEGVVSEAVAEAMARGALARTPTASHAVATTGVAGPSGGTDDTPVGTVCIAWADRRAGHIVTVSRRIRVPGSREDVTEGAVQVALQGLSVLLDGENPASMFCEFRSR